MYDVYSNPINILKRQLEMYGTQIDIQHYPTNEAGETDYTVEPVEFSIQGLYHSGTGKMGASSAIRFACTSNAGLGLGQNADIGILLLYDEEHLPHTGDICYLFGYKFYIQVVTDILAVHKILDVSLSVTGIVTP